MTDRTETARPQRRRRWVAAGLGLLLVAAAALLWPGLWHGSPAGESVGASSANLPATGLAWFGPKGREPAPKLAGSTLEGERLSLAQFRGTVVVVTVWGSWCAPCRDEAPDLARLARESRSEGVRFVGVDTRDNKAAARAFVRTFKIPYPSLFDPDGSLMLAFDGVVPISAVPSTVVIDPQGRVAARVVGKVTYSTLRGLVQDVLAEIPRSASPVDS
ncbi:MAG: TlpA family protein disulfide reductase [Pseudonocardiaceae bacterium]